MTRLCDAEAVQPGRATLVWLSQTSSVILLRQTDGAIIGYRNACPHMGIELDWEPARLLTRDARFLRCTGHHALFELETGVCTQGPCEGDRLTRVPLRVEEGGVWMEG
ncbi:MAG TPA: Rieske (2Fe-2S) protein [Rhodopila sp.]|uniref:Rieske (2Fe-2S) protein n=1 Tax=Rhodopila sp. TaxID=2480087 RepID=UPI002CCA13A3|nr:Rieske (2Fe-2S) protein [Rhodopila sp.]HVY15812.1 Rieske (2Fe-2S) protein [Rhodopila sp.]